MADEKKIYGDYVNTPSPYAKSKEQGKGYATTKVPDFKDVEKWLRSLTDFETICFAFSQIFGKAIYEGMGLVAEKYIAHELRPFLEEQNIAKEDAFLDDSMGTTDYTNFLHLKNPDLSRNSDEILKTAVPDILIHNVNLKEFYEIKPDSNDGRSAGREKLKKLNSNYSNPRCNLPYKEGKKFVPPDHIDMGVAVVVVDGVPYPIRLALGLRKEGALIFYELCIGTNWKVVMLAKALEALLFSIFKLLKAMLTKSKEFLKKLKDSIEKEKEAEVPAAAYAGVGLFLGAIVLVVTSEVTIPALLIYEVVEFFTAGVTAEFVRRAAAAQ